MSNALLFLAIPGAAAVLLLVLRLKRGVVYARMRRQQSQMSGRIATGAERWFTPSTTLPFFSRRLVSLANLLPVPILTHLRGVVAGARRDERSYIPGHKQGGTIAYEHLHAL